MILKAIKSFYVVKNSKNTIDDKGSKKKK